MPASATDTAKSKVKIPISNTEKIVSAPVESPAADSMERAPLSIERYFSTENIHPFDQIEWDKRTATIEMASHRAGYSRPRQGPLTCYPTAPLSM